MEDGNCRNEKPSSRRNTINGGRRQEEEWRARKNHSAAGSYKVTVVSTAVGQACRISNFKWTSGCSCVHCGGHREPKLIREVWTRHLHSTKICLSRNNFFSFLFFFLVLSQFMFQRLLLFQGSPLQFSFKIFIYLYFVDYLQRLNIQLHYPYSKLLQIEP